MQFHSSAEQRRAVAMLVLLLLIWGAGFSLYLYNQSAAVEWQRVPAKVLHTAVVENEPGFEPQVYFEYYINNVRYLGDQRSLNLRSRETRSSAEQQLTRFPPGSSFSLYVDPWQPKQISTTRVFVRTTERAIIASGLLILGSLLGLTMCVQFSKKARRRNSGVTRVFIEDGAAQGDSGVWTDSLLSPPKNNGGGSSKKSGKTERSSGVHS